MNHRVMMVRMSMFGTLENSLEKMTFKKSLAGFVSVVFRSYESSCSNGEHVDVWCFCRIVWRR